MQWPDWSSGRSAGRCPGGRMIGRVVAIYRYAGRLPGNTSQQQLTYQYGAYAGFGIAKP